MTFRRKHFGLSSYLYTSSIYFQRECKSTYEYWDANK